ncbi:MAG: PaaI family thioesterase [Azospirillaceae bacterium]
MDHSLTGEEPWRVRARAIVDGMPVLKLVGARLDAVEKGRAVMSLPFDARLTQQMGYQHAGITTLLADTCGGVAASTLMPDGADVLAVEFKINLMAPARAERFVAEAAVLRGGRTLSVVEIDVFGETGARRKHVARMQQTCITVPGETG